MSTLWTYGCSWTYSKCHEEDLGIKFWPTIVSEKLELNLVNRGFGGEGVTFAINKLINDLQYIKKDDIVVFQFSYGERMMLPYLNIKLKNSIDNYWSTINITSGNTRFLDKEKMIKYMDFVMSHNSELLVKDFDTVSLIFDYVENILGAKVKYWFIAISPFIYSQDALEFLNYKFLNFDRCVFFKSEKIEYEPLKYYFEAGLFINSEKLRICDRKYDKKVQWDIEIDDHPNTEGYEKIAEFIIDSIKNNNSELRN